MPHQQIAEIYRKNEENLLKDLKNPEGLQEKQVHQLRVHIKNMRVLLHLLEALSKKKFSARPILRLLNPVFNRAGKFRTASLNLKLTQMYRSAVLLRFKDHLRVEMEKQKQKMKSELEDFKIKKFKRLQKESLDAFKNIKSSRIKKQGSEYLRVLLAEVRVDLFDISDDETLHEIRHKLKEIKTVGAFLNECAIEHPFKKELDRIAVTYDRIGNWHDTAILIEDLEDFVEQLDDDSALEKTMPLIMVLKKKNLHNKKLIEKKLKVDLVM